MTTLAVMLFIAGVGTAAVGALLRFGEYAFSGIVANEQRLVYHTDLARVREACQLMLADGDRSGAATRPVSFSGPQVGNGVISEKVPALLRDLNFEDIMVDQDGVLVMFGGGFYHWGFAFPRSRETYHPPRDWGHWELIPGLWYWTEGGSLPPDPAKAPWLRTSTKYLCGSAALFVLGIGIIKSSSRRASPGAL